MKIPFKYHIDSAYDNVTEQLLSLDKAEVLSLPDLPTNTLTWIEYARPQVGGLTRNWDEIPFWIDVYEDNHPNKIIVNGRQTYKSTYGTDVIGCVATSHNNIEVTYCVDRQDRARAWSKQRFRRDTLLQNSMLRQFLPHGRANVDEVTLTNGTVVYIRTDENEFNRVEGLSNYLLLMDECQYQDLQFLTKATYTLTATKGKLEMLGIGGEAGSIWHDYWKKSDQREWIYDDKYWRDKLTFDNMGNIDNDPDKLKSILSGRWVAQESGNYEYRGYHMPQTIFATIPLTIQDAVTKYNTRPQNSVEYQKKNFPKSIYLSHTMGDFYKAERRPITPAMVYACMHPYRYLSMLKADEVRLLKDIYKNEIRVLMGVDFGSGPAASSTVITVLLHWRKSGRYQIAHIESRPQEHQLDQSRYISQLGQDYGIDHGIGDLGYGQIQVKIIQDGAADSKGNSFRGLGRKRFQGCRTIGDETRPQSKYVSDTDEHGTQLGRYQIDKTTSIQSFIDRIGTLILHPQHPNPEYSRPILMIPFAKEYETDWLVKDFCSITRKDLSKDPDITTEEDPRQRARKEFNHPPDSVMSIIYCFVADENYKSNAGRLFGVGH